MATRTFEATAHIDGAARGNPGPAAFAAVIQRPNLPVVEVSDSLGTATNNVAEYHGLIAALEKARELGIRRIQIFSDSELLVKQMSGEYRVKSPDLKELYATAQEFLKQFEEVEISHVRREQNKRADQLCNETLDALSKKKPSLLPTAAQSPSAKRPIGDDRVREECLQILRSIGKSWIAQGTENPPAELAWEQIWSVLEENQILKTRAGS